MTTRAALEYVDAAGELIQELLRVFRARRLYDEGHPKRREVEERAATRIGNLLDAHGTIELSVGEDALRVDGHVVHEIEASHDSMPHILFREGVREIVFYTGLTADELAVFLDDIAESTRGDDRDDGLVGRLWQESFRHLRYAFVEDLRDEEWIPPPLEREEEEETGKVELAPEDRTAEDAQRLVSEFDVTLYFLDDEDMAKLQEELETENRRSLVHEALTCLRELLIHPVRDDPEPILDVLVDMHERLLHEGAYTDVQKLHQLFIPYLESEVCDERGRETFARLREAALDERVLARLAHAVETGRVEERIAAGYYRAFGRDDPFHLLARAGDLKKLFQHPAIASAFTELAREHHDAVTEVLSGDDPRAAAAVAYLAGQIGDPRLLDGLAACLGSPDGELRREAIQALKQFGGGRALEIVSRAVDDPDPGVRLYALRHLVAYRYRPALPGIAELVETDAWRDRSPTEQQLIFEAYGALGGEGVMHDLARRLERRKGLLRRVDPEEMACALVALGAVGTPNAREFVEDVSDHKLPLVRRTAREVMDMWGDRTSSTEP